MPQSPDPTAPVLCLRTPGRLPKCGQCGSKVVVLSGLIGWHEGEALCPECLIEEAPELGWALRLVEHSAKAMATWPRQPESLPLSRLLKLLEAARRVLGPLHASNPKLPLALDLLRVVDRHARR